MISLPSVHFISSDIGAGDAIEPDVDELAKAAVVAPLDHQVEAVVDAEFAGQRNCARQDSDIFAALRLGHAGIAQRGGEVRADPARETLRVGFGQIAAVRAIARRSTDIGDRQCGVDLRLDRTGGCDRKAGRVTDDRAENDDRGAQGSDSPARRQTARLDHRLTVFSPYAHFPAHTSI